MSRSTSDDGSVKKMLSKTWEDIKSVVGGFPSKFSLTLWTWHAIAAAHFGVIAAILGNVALFTLYVYIIKWEPMPVVHKGAGPCQNCSDRKKSRNESANKKSESKRRKKKRKKMAAKLEPLIADESVGLIKKWTTRSKLPDLWRPKGYPSNTSARLECLIETSRDESPFPSQPPDPIDVNSRKQISLPAKLNEESSAASFNESLPGERRKRRTGESKSVGCRVCDDDDDEGGGGFVEETALKLVSIQKSASTERPAPTTTTERLVQRSQSSERFDITADNNSHNAEAPLLPSEGGKMSSSPLTSKVNSEVNTKNSSSLVDNREEITVAKAIVMKNAASRMKNAESRTNNEDYSKSSVDEEIDGIRRIDDSGTRINAAATSTSRSKLSDAEDFEFDFDYEDSDRCMAEGLRDMEEEEEEIVEDGWTITQLRGNYNNNNNNNNDDDDDANNNHFADENDKSSNARDSKPLSVRRHSSREIAQELKLGMMDSLHSTKSKEVRDGGIGGKKNRPAVRNTQSEVVSHDKPSRNATIHIKSETDHVREKTSGICCAPGVEEESITLTSVNSKQSRHQRSQSRCSIKSRRSNVSLFNDNEIWTPKTRELQKPIKEIIRKGPARENSTENVDQQFVVEVEAIQTRRQGPKGTSNHARHATQTSYQTDVSHCEKHSAVNGSGDRTSNVGRREASRSKVDLAEERTQQRISRTRGRGGDKKGEETCDRTIKQKSNDGRSRGRRENKSNLCVEVETTDYIPRQRQSAASSALLRRIDFAAASPPPTLECCKTIGYEAGTVYESSSSSSKKNNRARSVVSATRGRVDYVGKFVDDNSEKEERSKRLTKLRSLSSSCIDVVQRGNSCQRPLQRLPYARSSSTTTLSASSSTVTFDENGREQDQRHGASKRREYRARKRARRSAKTHCRPTSRSEHRHQRPLRRQQTSLQQSVPEFIASPDVNAVTNHRHKPSSKGEMCAANLHRLSLPIQQETTGLARQFASFINGNRNDPNVEMASISSEESTAPMFGRDYVSATLAEVGTGRGHGLGEDRVAGQRMGGPCVEAARGANVRTSSGANTMPFNGANALVNQSTNAKEKNHAKPLPTGNVGNTSKYIMGEEEEDMLKRKEEEEKRQAEMKMEEERKRQSASEEAKKREKRAKAETNRKEREWQEREAWAGRAEKYQRDRAGGGGGGFDDVRRLELEMNGSEQVRLEKVEKVEEEVVGVEELGKSVNRTDAKEENQIETILNHLKENRVLYLRLCLALAVISYWNWQTGGFGAKREFLRNLQSASITAAAAATVADGIAAAERRR